MNSFKIHCSAIHSIMAEAKSPRTISVGAESAVKAWYLSQIYKKPKSAKGGFGRSKETDKGLQMQKEATELLGIYDKTFYNENTQQYENGYLVGTPDIITDTEIIDIKCPYSCFSFPYFETSLPPVYYWQMQGYMELLGIKKARVAYCLMSAPDNVIIKEAYALAKERGEIELSLDIEDEVRELMSYEDTPIELRIKTFTVEHDPAAIERIYARVEACREYLKTIVPC